MFADVNGDYDPNVDRYAPRGDARLCLRTTMTVRKSPAPGKAGGGDWCAGHLWSSTRPPLIGRLGFV